ncbi:hypothetical protein QEG73_23390 [Chitinophagaceae bacterium 26-R-25]|nr:hypothetical protein [Chitinophagaceae bacterium 26-R-25]
MKAPKLLLGGLILLSMQGFSQTDTTKTPKDTTKKKDLSFVSVLDTVPEKKKDTTEKKDYAFNQIAKGRFLMEDNYLALDTVPGKKDTTMKRDTSKWISYAALDTVPKKDKKEKDTTKAFAFSYINDADTTKPKKHKKEKDSTGMFAFVNYAVLDTVPEKKDTSDKKKEFSFNDVAKGPFAVEDAYIVLDTVPNDTTKKPSGWGSLAPIPQAQPLSEFKSSAPAPNAGKYYVAVLGTYQPENTTTTETQPSATTTTTAGSNVTITVDDQNPGKIWVSGIGDDKFYAYLKSDANIYKIPAQKVSDKKSISEGIVSYNETSKEVHIRIGSGFNDADPAASLNGAQATASAEQPAEKPMKKGKNSHAVAKAPVKKVISFDGIKTDAGTASL